jgi:hypothetical protein
MSPRRPKKSARTAAARGSSARTTAAKTTPARKADAKHPAAKKNAGKKAAGKKAAGKKAAGKKPPPKKASVLNTGRGVTVIVVDAMVETGPKRVVISVDPWRAPVSRNGPEIEFRLTGGAATAMEIVPKDETDWKRVMKVPGSWKGSPANPVRVGVKGTGKKLASCAYSIRLTTPHNGTIEVDPEIFICD